jgi:hypothetical protein
MEQESRYNVLHDPILILIPDDPYMASCPGEVEHYKYVLLKPDRHCGLDVILISLY